MKNKDWFMIACIVCLLAIVGCSTAKAAFTDRFVPTFMANPSYTFCGYTNAPSTGVLFGFPSLKDAKLLKSEIEIVHAEHMIRYYAAKELNDKAVEGGEALQTALFDPDTGYASMGLSAVGGLLTGGLLSFGTYRKGLKTTGPGHVTKEELEAQKKMAGMMSPEDFKNTL